ncbi:polyribonucleotide nucleotidyltransferase 1, mitochondrial-like [Panonychus citri]|uniref:polyribonucleotide nucleotidyltransferase 1, mitochondrial-like n=1 Tax=Panonychus citri TaxID=50023 RepID=UPI00230793ED|nr:polyribonucleotide nucleotidyltransferase 1, mitochondrial-like [Panonychus citri]
MDSQRYPEGLTKNQKAKFRAKERAQKMKEMPQNDIHKQKQNRNLLREIGHGALAEKALRLSMPIDFPFTTRLNCEVLGSNGSSSMASVCAGSLALMDGGVPVTHPTAGVAIGLIHTSENKDDHQSSKLLPQDEKFIILTDILGIEDHFGEMDFKMAGTGSGLTALQLDIKLPHGLPIKVIKDALTQGQEATRKILEIMSRTIRQPNVSHKENWPITETIEIPPHRRSRIFSYGGSTIRKLTVNYGINLRQDDGDPNKLILFAPDKKSYEIAKKTIDQLLEMDDYEKKLEFKAIYTAKVVDIIDSGVKVIIFPGMDPVFIPNRTQQILLIQK